MAAPAPAPNRLANETSPYLLQHAHNPVDWYPWGPEALERARREDRPIFLSIGYAACHWCHVMERESFEDSETASLLNDAFVCIKVDREERPDLDEVYMTATQLLTGSGGWPMSVFLQPDLNPFFAGTYFPPEERWGQPAFRTVLRAVLEAYRMRRAEVELSALEIAEAVRHATTAPASARPARIEILQQAVAQLRDRFDPSQGGFSGAPKFPPSSSLELLLRQHARSGEAIPLEMATLTLDRMARGGIRDQIGGGFHRYSVDARWMVPHFEKMLYDNALLATVYLDAYRVAGSALYLETARGILEFVLHELTGPGGGFYSSLDADSEGEEGRFYVWSPEEIESVLGNGDARLLQAYYGVSPEGNIEGGRSVLHTPHPVQAVAQQLGLSGAELEVRLVPMRARLLEARSRRVRPGLDDKVLAGWNGLMISAFAAGFAVTGDERYRDAASRAADFVLSHMRREGRLLRTWSAGRAGSQAFLEDYAFLAEGLLDLLSASGEGRRLDEARELVTGMLDLFDDPDGGGFFFTPRDHEPLPARTKSLQDGATPSGNSVAAMVLLRLGRLTDDAALRDRGRDVIEAHSDLIERAPSAFARLLCALDFMLGPPREIVIAGARGSAGTRALRAIVDRFYLPNTLVVEFDPDSDDGRRLASKVPLLEGKIAAAGIATAYVCENGACRKPETSPVELERMLRSLQSRPGG